MSDFLSSRWIRDAYQAVRERRIPRVHGNGFVQVDLDDRTRLHVWGHPAIPRQRVPTPVHDHIYGFRSEVLTGMLRNVVLSVRPCAELVATHPLRRAVTRADFDTTLEALPEDGHPWVLAVPTSRWVVSEGGYYCMAAGVFHESVPLGPCVTVMRRDGPNLADQVGAGAPPDQIRRPRILVPVGQVPDNDFRRDAYAPELIWPIVEACVPEWMR